jgi:predicted kinase
MGVGKSTVSNILRKKLPKTAIIKIEDIRSLVTGPEDNTLAWEVIYKMCDEYFKNGVNVLVEQTVASTNIVNKFLKLAKRYKCNICFYHFMAPKEELVKRIKNRQSKSRIAKNLIASNYEKHQLINYPSATIIDTSTMSPAQISKLVLTP